MDEQEPLLLDTLRQEGRIGKFRVSRHLLSEMSWSMLQRMMANFFIVRAEQWWTPYDGIEYMAYSPLFGVTDPGEEVPHYNPLWNSDCDLVGVNRLD
jgi:hypothetical protein